jgi:DNA-binding XRE family transcriptional regulator
MEQTDGPLFEKPYTPPPIDVAVDAARFARKLQGRWPGLPLRQQYRELRRYRCMSQSDVALMTGYSQAAISDFETGRTSPPWSAVQRLFFALDCAPVVLPKAANLWPFQHRLWRDPKAGQFF